jgi:hypothetical protein
MTDLVELLVDPIFGAPLWWADEQEERERLERDTDLFMLRNVVMPKLAQATPVTGPRAADPEIPRWVRQIVISRDGGSCAICGCASELVMGHLISRADGKRLGLTWADIHSPENIRLMCWDCNDELHARSLSTPVIARLILAAQKLDNQLPLRRPT